MHGLFESIRLSGDIDREEMITGTVTGFIGVNLRSPVVSIVLAVMMFAIVPGCSRNDTNAISGSGTIETTEVIVAAKVGGEILRLYVDEGAAVKQGDTLAEIDHADYDIQLKQVQANTEAADAQYKLAVAGARTEDIVQAEAQMKNARDDAGRMRNLLVSHAVTQKQVDDAETRYTVAQQTYDKLKNGSRPEEIQAALARKNQAVAQADAIRKKISDSYVIAPIDGVVTLKAFEQGETAVPNSALFRISEVNKVHLMVYIPESDLAKVKLGEQASVSIDGAPGKIYPGAVVYTSPVAEFTPKNIQTKDERTKLVFGVKIEIPNPNLELKPGMPADAVIHK